MPEWHPMPEWLGNTLGMFGLLPSVVIYKPAVEVVHYDGHSSGVEPLVEPLMTVEPVSDLDLCEGLTPDQYRGDDLDGYEDDLDWRHDLRGERDDDGDLMSDSDPDLDLDDDDDSGYSGCLEEGDEDWED